MVQVELDMSYDAFCAKGVELQDRLVRHLENLPY